METGELHIFEAKTTLLATGGAGRIFAASTNAFINTGDGLGMAARAGIPLEDMEFWQFHPTGVHNAGVLLTEQDFYDMARAYLARAAMDNVAHAEIFFDPQTHTARGVPMDTVIHGLARACHDARAELGISSSLILCFLRHLSEREAFETLEAALPHRARFIGVGLDSSELGHPPEKFARVFARCRALGLHIVAHAGEEGHDEE